MDTVANTVTAHGVETFGVFGLGVEAQQPTALTVRAFRDLPGFGPGAGLVGTALLAAGVLHLGVGRAAQKRRK